MLDRLHGLPDCNARGKFVRTPDTRDGTDLTNFLEGKRPFKPRLHSAHLFCAAPHSVRDLLNESSLSIFCQAGRNRKPRPRPDQAQQATILNHEKTVLSVSADD